MSREARSAKGAESRGLLALVRESGGEFGMAVGRGDHDEVVDVQIAATGECAAALVREVEAWHGAWMSDRDELTNQRGFKPSKGAS